MANPLSESDQPESDSPQEDTPAKSVRGSFRASHFLSRTLLLSAALVITLALLAVIMIAALGGSTRSTTLPTAIAVQRVTVQSSVTHTPKTGATRMPTSAVSTTATAVLAITPRVTITPQSSEPFITGPITIGQSAQGRPLAVYRLGHGVIKRALIGAIHGGYEWNTAELMTRTLDYLRDNPDILPSEITLYVLPIANPDGYAAGTDAVHGRENGNQVDLNRNWDYHWQITATHGTRIESSGQFAFSEPETEALRDFIVGNQIADTIFYHSAMSEVFQGAGVTKTKTIELAKLMAEATGYRYAPEGVPGQITTGDAIDWLTVNGHNAIEVELSTHQDIDWERNLNGLHAFLNWNLPQKAKATEPATP